MPAWSLIGAFDAAKPLLPWMFSEAASEAWPVIAQLKSDPLGMLSRLGDTIVWQGEGGTKLLFGLESMGEQVGRIDQAVSGIESTQIAMQGSLGLVQTVSMATLGVTSLSAGFMVWRLNALANRLNRLSEKIEDVEGQIDAANKAHLRSSLQYLSDYEKKERATDLDHACECARMAGNIYGQTSQDEALTQKRLPVLNYRCRCYLLALLTELECLMLCEDQHAALERLEHEQPRLTLLAQTTFAETLAKAPEAYLDPSMKAEGITMEVMTEVYQQAHHSGAIGDVEIKDAAEMFEHVRNGIYRRRKGPWWVWKPAGAAKRRYVNRLKYLIACVEDVNRIEAFRLLLEEAESKRLQVRELLEKLKHWRKESADRASTSGPGILAYTYS